MVFHAKTELEYGGLKARAYWYGLRTDLDIDIDLKHEGMGLTLGTIPTLILGGDTVHADVQYDLKLHENDLIIAGLDFRFTNYRCDQLVNPDISEARFGLFLLDERRITRQIHLTLGARVDFNTKTNVAISPKLALVYNIAEDHFLRIATGTAFRKPTIIETAGNFKVDAAPSFPEVKTLFEERGISNPNLDNEVLSIAEIGYRGSFLDRSLRLSANAYFAYNEDLISLTVDIRFNEFMQIDMDNTNLGYANSGGNRGILGGGVSIEGDLAEVLSLFLRGEISQQWEVDQDDNWNSFQTQMQATAGGVWHSAGGLAVMLAAVFVGKIDNESLRDPASVLGPTIRRDVPAHTYLMATATYRLNLGTPKMIIGLSLFNPLGARFFDLLSARAPDGSNFGAEPQGPHALLTARLVY
jgi:outer membrane receptor protein involved in Fe transport